MLAEKYTSRKVLEFIRKRCRSPWKILFILVSIIVLLGINVAPYRQPERSTENYETIASSTVNNFKELGASNFSLTHRLASSNWNYCKIEHCQTITCSDIPANFDPAEILSSFVVSEFKILCATSPSIDLVFRNCKFSSNKLQKDWLPIDVVIEKLEIKSCSLREIADDAFSRWIFHETKSISLVNNRICCFGRSIFKPLQKLRGLNVEENVMELAEANLLENVANTLQTLTLNAAVKDSQLLRNITGKDSLKELQILSLKGNSIPTIDRQLLSGANKIRSLYLDDSEVREIDWASFDPMAGSLQQLFIGKNNLSSLPSGVFDRLVKTNANFRLSLDKNPWHCDCSLNWMKNFVQNFPAVVNSVPVCQSPEKNAFLTFLQAQFCDETLEEITPSVIYTSESISTTKRDDECDGGEKGLLTKAERVVKVVCVNQRDDTNYLRSEQFFLSLPPEEQIPANRFAHRKLLSKVDYELFRMFNNFSTLENEDGTVSVVLPKVRDANITLVWFKNDIFGSLSNNRCLSDSIHCAKNVLDYLSLKNLEAESSYTICLFDSERSDVSPLNCLSLTTNAISGAKAWLSNEDKTLTLSVSTLVLLLIALFSAFLMYLVIRRHPSLLKGSKRVVMVKRRKLLNALVLPRDVEDKRKNLPEARILAEPKDAKDDGYVTPLTPLEALCRPVPLPSHCRKPSRTSCASLLSYTSGLEPTYSHLTAWRAKSETLPPPLPPHHPKLAPNSPLRHETLDEPFSIL